MIDRIRRPYVLAAIVVGASGILAGSNTRAADTSAAGPNPFSSVTCSKTTPCVIDKNSNTGAGLEGENTSTSSSATAGLLGMSTGPAAGVEGVSSNSTQSSGVVGIGNVGDGVVGIGNNGHGVTGISNGNDAAVFANATAGGPGIVSQASFDGIDASSISGYGLHVTSAYVAIRAESGSTAIQALSNTGAAIIGFADSAYAMYSENDSTAGFGLLSVTPPSGNAYPLVARDTKSNNLFYVDGLGDVFYHGTLNHFLTTDSGTVAESYTPTSASPTIEDNGTAHLVNGMATVALDPAFAHAIDVHRVYQVMLTPDGDTRGLYTATKTPTSFIVREVQGGHGTLDFDYHIYAPSLGQAGVRMREMTRARAAASAPRPLQITRPSVRRPARPPG